MKTKIGTLFREWDAKRNSVHAYIHGNAPHIEGRNDIEIARDILALAGEQRPGQVMIHKELLDDPVIKAISRHIIDANNFIAGRYGNPRSQGVVTNGAGLPLFGEDLKMACRASAIEWASLPLPG